MSHEAPFSVVKADVKVKRLAAKFLEELAERMSNDGCNDWDWPDDWTQVERDGFALAYHVLNGDLEEYHSGERLPNFCVVHLLAFILESEATT